MSKLAEFTKECEDGAFVLHVAGKDGVEIIRTGDRDAREALRLMAKKNVEGQAWLRGGKPYLLRPHPLLGLIKGFYKGNIPKFVNRIAEDCLDPYGWLIIPILIAWTLIEMRFLYGRVVIQPKLAA